MPKTKAQKAVIVAGIADKFRAMKSVAFSSVAGYTMAQADALRAKAAAENVDVFISKKTLLELAAKEANLPVDRDALQGSILTAVSYGDEVAAAKLLKDLTKANDQVKLVSGVLEGKVISASEVLALAALPSKQQLLGQLVGTLQAPISGFVRVMAGNLQGLVGVLGAIKEKKA
jgi:large subunit ribosomal protein L10